MRIAILVNDSYFSYLIAKPVIKKFGNCIALAVFSTRTTGSWRRIWAIFRKTNVRYFIYRSLVDLVSRVNRAKGRQTVQALVVEQGIPVVHTADISETATFDRFTGMDVGVAINFDQLIPPAMLNALPKGVINTHASRLPHDKGISPAIWAFARGDMCIWTTIYSMGSELDCGTILDQFSTPVNVTDTAFALYRRVCVDAGTQLTKVLGRLEDGNVKPLGESRADAGNYNGWPDNRHRAMLNRSERKLWRLADLVTAMTSR
jgi:methionyl-tRNA formyltransferase